MREIITRWDAEGQGGGLSVMYFADGLGTIAEQRAALGDLWATIDGNLTPNTQWSVDAEGREIDFATGTLTGGWSEGTVYAGAGGLSSTPVPNVAQALLRWATDSVVGGRLVKGRTYVPGFANELTNDGEIPAAYLGTMGTACQAFADAEVGFSVWHRPVSGSGGSLHTVTGGSVWREFAIQRGRRG